MFQPFIPAENKHLNFDVDGGKGDAVSNLMHACLDGRMQREYYVSTPHCLSINYFNIDFTGK